MDLKRKKIFIAGHKGLVGSSILKEMKRRNIEPITIEKHELDLLDQYNKTNNLDFFKNEKENFNYSGF